MTKLNLFFLTLSLLSSISMALAEPMVVVGSSQETVTLEELHTIYFQNGGRLSNGEVVIPLDYREANPDREQFYQRAFGRSKAQMKAYCAQRIFTGKGNPPLTVETVKECAQLVSTNASSYIGYMNESENKGNLKVLLRIP